MAAYSFQTPHRKPELSIDVDFPVRRSGAAVLFLETDLKIEINIDNCQDPNAAVTKIKKKDK